MTGEVKINQERLQATPSIRAVQTGNIKNRRSNKQWQVYKGTDKLSQANTRKDMKDSERKG